MKKSIFLFVLWFGMHFVFAEISESVVQNTLAFETSLYQIQSDGFLSHIEQFSEKNEKSELTEEEKLYCQNIALLQKVDFVLAKENEKEIYYELLKQNDKNIDFFKKNNSSSKYLYVSAAYLQSRLIKHLSGGQLYKMSLSSKELYQKAIKLDKNFSNAHLGYALWLFFAPAIAGGGFDAALKQMNKAVNSAKTPLDKYKALVYRSQIYFKLNNKNKWKEDLNNAKNILPKGSLHTYAEAQNEKNKLLFD